MRFQPVAANRVGPLRTDTTSTTKGGAEVASHDTFEANEVTVSKLTPWAGIPSAAGENAHGDEIAVRLATPEDAEGIHRLLLTISQETPYLGDWGPGIRLDQFRAFLAQQHQMVLLVVAVDYQHKICGYGHVINSTVFGLPQAMGHIAQIAVAVEAAQRRRGLAKRLIRFSVEAAAHAMDVLTVRATIWDSNAASIRAFQQAGFVAVAMIPGQFRDDAGGLHGEILMNCDMTEWRMGHGVGRETE